MAFNWWSVPLYVAAAALVLVITVLSSRGARRAARTALLIIAVVILAVLSMFASWVGQGGPNYWGEMLYLAALGVLAGAALMFWGVGKVISRGRASRRRREVDLSQMRRFLVPLVVVFAVLAALVWSGQRSFIYFPEHHSPGPAATYVERGSDVELHTADGLTLQAWRIDPDSASRDVAVLYLPGNAGNRFARLPVAQALADQGFTVLLLEYRGFGGNPGRPSEQGLAHDADAAQAYLDQAGFPASRTIYVGESLGTGVAVQLAERATPAGVLLRSPYTSLGDVASYAVGDLPIGWILRDRFDTLSRMPTITAPVSVLAGAADTTIPSDQSFAVAGAAAHLEQWLELPEVGHNDDIWFGPYLAEQVAHLADRDL